MPILALLIGYSNPAVFSIFVSVVVLLALLEFGRMGLGTDFRTEQWVAAIYGSLSIPLLFFGYLGVFAFVSTIVFLSLATSFLFRFKTIESVHFQFGWILFGLLYVPLLLGHLLPLRFLPFGQKWVFLTLFVIMGCDSFAYFIGRKIGKRKLYKAVSPNKSIEGAIGGLVGSVFAVSLCKFTFMPFIGVLDGLIIGLTLGTAGQIGDLFESLLKRACGVKDSGTIIPGHGGVTDLPTVTYYTKNYLSYMLEQVEKVLDEDEGLSGAYEIDQSAFRHWKTYRELSLRNAARIYKMLEFE